MPAIKEKLAFRTADDAGRRQILEGATKKLNKFFNERKSLSTEKARKGQSLQTLWHGGDRVKRIERTFDRIDQDAIPFIEWQIGVLDNPDQIDEMPDVLTPVRRKDYTRPEGAEDIKRERVLDRLLRRGVTEDVELIPDETQIASEQNGNGLHVQEMNLNGNGHTPESAVIPALPENERSEEPEGVLIPDQVEVVRTADGTILTEDVIAERIRNNPATHYAVFEIENDDPEIITFTRQAEIVVNPPTIAFALGGEVQETPVDELEQSPTLTSEKIFAVGAILRSEKMRPVLAAANNSIDAVGIKIINDLIERETTADERKKLAQKFKDELLSVGMNTLVDFSKNQNLFFSNNPMPVNAMMRLISRLTPPQMEAIVEAGLEEFAKQAKGKSSGSWFHRSTHKDEVDAAFGRRLVVGSAEAS